MLSSTRNAIQAILSADPTIDAGKADAALKAAEDAANGNPTAIIEQLMTRKEVAAKLKVTPQRVDQIARAGALRKVIPPGLKRSMGFTRSSVALLMNGKPA